MIQVQDAVKNALTQLNAIMPQYAGSEARLEEVELAEQEDAWLITFSVPAPNANTFPTFLGQISPSSPFGSNRVGKVVKLRASDGQFISVKQRVA
jgi:hypothetical protein